MNLSTKKGCLLPQRSGELRSTGIHLHPQCKLCCWEKEGTDLSGLRGVPSALPGDGGGAGRQQPYAPSASSSARPTALRLTRHPCLQASLPFPVFPSHTLALPSEVESCQRRCGDQEKAFPAGVSGIPLVCPPNPQFTQFLSLFSCCHGLS